MTCNIESQVTILLSIHYTVEITLYIWNWNSHLADLFFFFITSGNPCSFVHMVPHEYIPVLNKDLVYQKKLSKTTNKNYCLYTRSVVKHLFHLMWRHCVIVFSSVHIKLQDIPCLRITQAPHHVASFYSFHRYIFVGFHRYNIVHGGSAFERNHTFILYWGRKSDHNFTYSFLKVFLPEVSTL